MDLLLTTEDKLVDTFTAVDKCSDMTLVSLSVDDTGSSVVNTVVDASTNS